MWRGHWHEEDRTFSLSVPQQHVALDQVVKMVGTPVEVLLDVDGTPTDYLDWAAVRPHPPSLSKDLPAFYAYLSSIWAKKVVMHVQMVRCVYRHSA